MALSTEASGELRVSVGDPARHRAVLDDGYIGVRAAADGAVIYQRLRGSAADQARRASMIESGLAVG
jgi:hypothetical protein